jgi:hypothetical protein
MRDTAVLPTECSGVRVGSCLSRWLGAVGVAEGAGAASCTAGQGRPSSLKLWLAGWQQGAPQV